MLAPRFKLGLDQRDHGASVSQQRRDGRHDLEQGNKRHVDGNKINGLADVFYRDVAYIGPLHIDDPFVRAQFPGQLAVPHVDGEYLGRPVLQGAVRKPACRRADIHHRHARQVDRKGFHRFFQLQSASADVGNGIALHRYFGVDGNLRSRLVDALIFNEYEACHNSRLRLFPAFRQPSFDEQHVEPFFLLHTFLSLLRTDEHIRHEVPQEPGLRPQRFYGGRRFFRRFLRHAPRFV